MSLIGWILFGALVGWLSGLLTGHERSCCGNVLVGIVGAVIGGAIYSFLTGAQVMMTFSLGSVAISVLGAIVLTFVVGMFAGERKT